jgi:prophage antirepressor-like protein
MSNFPTLIPYGKRSVRTVNLNGIIKFSATDICNILGYVNANKILGRYCDSSPEYIRLHTPGGQQNVRMIEKSDIEDILSHSTRRTVPRVRRWLADIYAADKEV